MMRKGVLSQLAISSPAFKVLHTCTPLICFAFRLPSWTWTCSGCHHCASFPETQARFVFTFVTSETAQKSEILQFHGSGLEQVAICYPLVAMSSCNTSPFQKGQDEKTLRLLLGALELAGCNQAHVYRAPWHTYLESWLQLRFCRAKRLANFYATSEHNTG